MKTTNNFLLEGLPGIGKTTLIKNIADKLSDFRIRGFYTEEIREKGTRVGFRIRTFSNQEGILAHVSFRKGPRVGKYRVDVSQFESIGVAELNQALQISELIIIDEIGKMELFSGSFKDALVRCLDSDKPVIATIMLRPNQFVDKIKQRSDVFLVEVTLTNRDRLPDVLIKEVAV
jgi:nucleoside-triphosphatase THEP1